MSKTVSIGRVRANKNKKPSPFASVSFEEGFHFFTGSFKYSGLSATSLFEFAEKIKTVPVQSITYHLHREDFQRWFRNIVGDEMLAERIEWIEKWPFYSLDEDLRKEIYKAVSSRIKESEKTLYRSS